MNAALQTLASQLDGALHFDHTMRILYATDASVYRELPLAVALPRHTKDIRQLIDFARAHGTSLIPRTAGTSLAGQCVGSGIVVDVSKHMNQILDFNPQERWVRVQPGVIRDELNAFLKPHGLHFGPDTSTVNRCMIGGMVGNNSCGSTSIVYGSTRDYLLEVEALLSDGSAVTFGALSVEAFHAKTQLNTLEGELYRQLAQELSQPEQQARIREQFPKASIHRRNTGYAVDLLLGTAPFSPKGEAFNCCKLLAGSEGTLAFMTSIKLHLEPLPPPHKVLLCPHFESVTDALKAVLIGMEHQPTALEMMDKVVMDCTKESIEYRKNRFFVEGDPEAVLMIEFSADTEAEALAAAHSVIATLQAQGLGYAHPIIQGARPMKQVWELRKAGLGLLANIPGDAKAVAVIEDTAVDVRDLPAYIAEFTQMMNRFGQQAVYYAHAGAGELHLRPILNLKDSRDVQAFYDIAKATAELVKRYDGSLSGEHGDGRVRAEFIPIMIGEENYALLKRIKYTWDPQGIFNPGKIVDAPPMNTSLRYEPDAPTPELETVFDFSATGGILRAAEKCNGSGDCRKLPLSGGTMCPSYRATRDEKDTTRARANILREMLTRHSDQPNPFNHPEIYEVLDLCLSCKGCTSECPSNVDMSTLKAEFLHQYYKSNGIPLRARAFANITRLNAIGSWIPAISNFFLTSKATSSLLKRLLRVAPQRSLPTLQHTTLRRWYQRHYAARPFGESPSQPRVYLFCDEFTNYNDTHIGIKAVQLLHALGYRVELIDHPESGRAHISKGLLLSAKALANRNVRTFAPVVSADAPLLGIEPSAILSFRDEYPRLVDADLVASARALSEHTYTVEEFLGQAMQAGTLDPAVFHTEARHIKLHGHCHQKALSSIDPTTWLLSLPERYTVEVIPSGCCGMAGSFGYEAEHYEVSMKVGEQTLFPAVRAAAADTIIAAPGTSCRHQIADGTGRTALHPIEILWDALLPQFKSQR